MRGRGLKQMLWNILKITAGSPPMRGRGLKRINFALFLGLFVVAPHAGAWIETDHCFYGRPWCQVAPHAGAWIETVASANGRVST